MKKPSKKRFILGAIILVLTLPLISLGKLLAYEANPKTSLIRGSAGREVTVTDGILDQPFNGILVTSQYRFNDVVGFFDLEVRVKNDKGGEMVTGLGPWDLCRVTMAEKYNIK